MKLKLHPVKLKLIETFTISRGSYNERESLIIELSENGQTGYGEASAHAYYGVTMEALIKRAEELRILVENYNFKSPELFWETLNEHLHDFPFLLCAFDNAAHDLYGKIKGQPCHKLWNLNTDNIPKSCFTFGIDSVDNLIKKIKENQFDIYKIKLGTPNDMEVIRALRKKSNAIFRIDANCAWTAEETISNSIEMKKLGVEFIEQPLKDDDWEGIKLVREKTALPIIADESCRTEADVEKCADFFHGICIKLMKCGGITPALRMIKKARKLNLKIMFGCMVESSVGISAIAQLLPYMDYVDMDGAILLANDPATGAKILKDGTVVLPKENGLGIKMI